VVSDASDRNETPAETQYRLRSEAECRRIAGLIKSELPAGMGFVLITADLGEAGASFSNLSYTASIDREDSARMLTELLNGGMGTEPSVATATKMREFVYRMRDTPLAKLLHGARCSVRDLEPALRMREPERAAREALKLASEAMAIFGQCVSEIFRRVQSQAQSGN
jgi:hypothetical protein